MTSIVERTRPTGTMRALSTAVSAYRMLFAESRAAEFLSRPNPVRYSGFDLDLVVDEIRTEAAGVSSLALAAPDGSVLPAWLPGAHVDVFLPSGRQRQYSLCGDPDDRHSYRIAVRRIAEGLGGSAEVHDEVCAGERITVRGPRNAFRLVEAESYLFVAGGIGITPILPMVRSCHRAGADWHLVYLGRGRDTMPFLGELSACDTGRVDVRTDDESGVPDVADILTLAEPGAAVYLCGPPPLMNPARALLRESNPGASLHTERFSPQPVVGGKPFDVELRRSGTTVPVASDETALTAIRREVAGVAYSCQQGVCGTCKVGVLNGQVEHRDRLLTPDERDDAMLICVSRSAGGTITVDL